jgi:hypothetical protein
MLFLLAPLAWAGCALGAECLRYEPDPVALNGTLKLTVFPGPPNYRSLQTGDQPEAVWMLRLARPVCIDAIPGDSWNIDQAQVPEVQVVPRTSFSMAMNGKDVVVEGSLSRARGGHPHAVILLRATAVRVTTP